MKLTTIAAAILVGSLAFGQNAIAAPLDAAQKAEIQSVIHDYIMANPQVVLESVQNLQKKQMEVMQQKVQETAMKNSSSIFNQSGDPIAGNPNGKVTIAEFFDYQCPHCVDMAPALDGVIKANPDLRVVFKELPIRGDLSVFAAKAALAANKQGKYWQMHQLIMKNASKLSQDSILNMAKSIGLDVEKLKADMNGPEVDAQIKSNYKLAQELQVMGTPALFVGKTKNATVIEFIPGQTDQSFLQKSIDKAKG